MPDIPHYHRIREQLAEHRERHVDPARPLSVRDAEEVPSEETILQLLGSSPDRVAALAMAIAADLADPEMTEESISRMFLRSHSGVFRQGETLPGLLARDWQQFREALWAFVRGDDKALERIQPEVIRFSRWTASRDPTIRQAYAWAPLHVHLLHSFALSLLEFESIRNSSSEEMRRDVGRLMGSYMFNLLANIPAVRQGAQIHAVSTAQRREQSRAYRRNMRREWWEAANRRLAVREGLGVEMQEGKKPGDVSGGMSEWKPDYDWIVRTLENPRMRRLRLPVQPGRAIQSDALELPEDLANYTRQVPWADMLHDRYVLKWSAGVRRAAVVAALHEALVGFPVDEAEQAGSLGTGTGGREFLERVRQLAYAWLSQRVLHPDPRTLLVELHGPFAGPINPRPGVSLDWAWRELNLGLQRTLRIMIDPDESDSSTAHAISWFIASAISTAHYLDPPDSSPYPTEPPRPYGPEAVMLWWDSFTRLLPVRGGAAESVI